MATDIKLLDLLSKNAGQYMSGQALADTLGVSRNSIWKAIKKLISQGYDIQTSQGLGYRLATRDDNLSESYFKSIFSNNFDVYVFDTIESTNSFAKTLDVSNRPAIVLSNQQTKGRGRLGRSFFSPANAGIYMSIAFKPDFGIDRAMFITSLTAVVTCKAIESITGLSPKIKWVNDIYLDSKKVCGILTEAETNIETGQIDKIVVGIGINCFETKLPEEISTIATSLDKSKNSFSRNQLASQIISDFFAAQDSYDKEALLSYYRQNSLVLGKEILIFNPYLVKKYGFGEEKITEGIRAKAIDVDENGGLIVQFLEGALGTQEILTTGEITIRLC